jgi:hypothetical protein
LAQLPSFHLASISAFSHAFLTAPDRAPRGRFSITRGVRRVLEKETVVRPEASLGSEDGPSTRAYDVIQFSFLLVPNFIPERLTYALVVDNLDDGSQGASLELQHATDLHAAPGARSDLDFCRHRE